MNCNLEINLQNSKNLSLGDQYLRVKKLLLIALVIFLPLEVHARPLLEFSTTKLESKMSKFKKELRWRNRVQEECQLFLIVQRCILKIQPLEVKIPWALPCSETPQMRIWLKRGLIDTITIYWITIWTTQKNSSRILYLISI